MPTGTATAHRFDTDNRAYHRWRNLIDQHFTILAWETADTGRPALVTVLDPDNGDAFTVAILESIEERDPHALLTISVTARLLAYGPFAGEPATANAAPALAHANPDIHATCPVPLHDPAQPTLPDSAWRGIPPHLTDLQPAPADAPGRCPGPAGPCYRPCRRHRTVHRGHRRDALAAHRPTHGRRATGHRTPASPLR